MLFTDSAAGRCVVLLLGAAAILWCYYYSGALMLVNEIAASAWHRC